MDIKKRNNKDIFTILREKKKQRARELQNSEGLNLLLCCKVSGKNSYHWSILMSMQTSRFGWKDVQHKQCEHVLKDLVNKMICGFVRESGVGYIPAVINHTINKKLGIVLRKYYLANGNNNTIDDVWF